MWPGPALSLVTRDMVRRWAWLWARPCMRSKAWPRPRWAALSECPMLSNPHPTHPLIRGTTSGDPGQRPSAYHLCQARRLVERAVLVAASASRRVLPVSTVATGCPITRYILSAWLTSSLRRIYVFHISSPLPRVGVVGSLLSHFPWFVAFSWPSTSLGWMHLVQIFFLSPCICLSLSCNLRVDWTRPRRGETGLVGIFYIYLAARLGLFFFRMFLGCHKAISAF